MKLTNLFIPLRSVVALAASCKHFLKATDTTTGQYDSSGIYNKYYRRHQLTTTTVNCRLYPKGTQTAFTTQYPAATNVIWTTYDVQASKPDRLGIGRLGGPRSDDYLVRFDMDNENYYAWYDNSGKLGRFRLLDEGLYEVTRSC